MALEAGSVYAVLGGKFMPTGFAQFDAAMKKSAASAGVAEAQINRSSGRSAAAMGALGTAARTGAAAGLLAVGVAAASSVKSARTFEAKMSDLQAVSGATSKQFAVMRKAALDLGASTGVGATKAAGALTDLAKGGLDAETSIQALRGTIRLAQAGDMELADASNTVVKALSMFNLQGTDASLVADGLASAANATSMDVRDFAMALGQGGVAAASAGFSFEDTVNIMASLGNKFMSGSDMGTSLKNTIVSMAAPTGKAKEEMDRLGISLFDAEGKHRSVAEIVSQLSSSFGKLSDQERIAAAKRIAGTDSMRTLLALMDASGKSIVKQGSAQDLAAEKMDNYEGASKRLSASLESLKIEAGTALMPALADAADGLAKFFNQIRTGEGLGGTVADIAKQFIRIQETVWMLASGVSFERMGEIWGDGFINASLKVLGAIRAIASAINTVASIGGGKMNPFAGLAGPARDAMNNIDGITSRLRGIQNTKANVKILADNKSAISSIQQIQRSKIAPKVAKILGQDTDAKSKIQALIKLGIPRKIATVLANTGSARGAIAQLRQEMAAITSKTVTITVRRVGDAVGGTARAAGRGAGGAETALVGEGGGPEYIVDTATGRSRRVDSAQVVDLKPTEYVIPTESRYRGRALGLIAQMASDMGLVGYGAGREARSAGKKKLTPAERKALAEAKRLKAFSRHSLEWYDDRISNLESKADNKKNGKLTAGAYKARRELREIRAERKLALDYKGRIDAATTEADIQTDLMSAAERSGNPEAFRSAYGERKRQIARAIELLTAAVPKAKGTFKQSLRAQLAKLQSDQAQLESEPGDLGGDGFTASEQDRIDALDAAIALAQIDTPDDFRDDKARIQDKIDFLTGALSSARSAGRPSQAIVALAGALKSARDEMTSLTGSGTPGLTPDQQAQNEQQMNRDRINAQSAFIDRLVGATIGGAGNTLVFQSYVPPSPTEAKRLADYTVGGIGYQGGVPSSRESVGV